MVDAATIPESGIVYVPGAADALVVIVIAASGPSDIAAITLLTIRQVPDVVPQYTDRVSALLAPVVAMDAPATPVPDGATIVHWNAARLVPAVPDTLSVAVADCPAITVAGPVSVSV